MAKGEQNAHDNYDSAAAKLLNNGAKQNNKWKQQQQEKEKNESREQYPSVVRTFKTLKTILYAHFFLSKN